MNLLKLKEMARSYSLVLISFIFVSWVVANCSDYFAGQSVISMAQKYGDHAGISTDANLYLCYNPDELIGMNIPFISPFKYKKRTFEKEIPLDTVSTVFTSSNNEKIKLTNNKSLIISYESSSNPGMFFVQNSENKKLSTVQQNSNLPFLEPNKLLMNGNLQLMTIGGFWYYLGLACSVTLGLCVILPDYFRTLRKTNL